MKVLIAAAVATALLCGPAAARSGVLVLTPGDEAAYLQAFAAANDADWRAARAALSAVTDRSLAAHVEARALLARDARPRREAVAEWLARHPGHVLAPLVRRRGAALGARNLPAAAPPRERAANPAARRPADNAPEVAALFGAGDFAAARALATTMAEGPRRAAAAWWLGLLSWRDGDHARAASWFHAVATDARTDAWGRSAGHFWAGRALLAQGDAGQALRAFDAAAREPATFYGQLAEAQLGRDSALSFQPPAFEARSAAAFLQRHPGARRAAGLAQLGLLAEVELELKALHGRLQPAEDRDFLALAIALSAPAAQLRVAERGGPEVAAGYCPVTTFEPEDGFRLDRALLYAVVRQESRFSPIAISTSNARGLMQLLPSTAQDMERAQPLRRQPVRLHEPGLNMRLGQQYIEWLDANFKKGGDIARIFAAYNGGPGWLARWEAAYPRTDDPLLWLESIPRHESRDYAERVMSHLALCRKRYGQPPVELMALASGRAPIYRPMDANAGGAAYGAR
ncbi:MAG: lytic transglycosylase domain-containing protein [Hyphomonadaceae bacterium]|nr:lytic transglycosylase domain-containing protein [Hyphomonadaceae bacterium]